MHLFEIMNTNIQSISPREPAERARDLMHLHGIHHLVVLDGGKTVGIVAESDVGGRHAPVELKNRTVEEVMTESVISASPKTTLREAANLLRGHVIGCLPVMDGGKLKGVVSITDLLDLFGRGTATPRRVQFRRVEYQNPRRLTSRRSR